tara:strand:+ start:60150 stop:61379 length:1230 start_codon:yes stop_codon:yes gene_type:complete
MNKIQLQSIRSKITNTLFVTQALFGATQVAAFTVVPILSAQISDSERMTGIPMTVAFMARAIFAFPFGWIMDQFGRRYGLIAGYIASITAGVTSFISVIINSFPIFCLASIFAGMARSSSEQARFIAAEIYPEEERPKILSKIVSAGTISAIGGALMVTPSGIFIAQYGYPPMAGPFLIGAVLSLFCVVFASVLVRPDPLTLSQQLKQDVSDKNIKLRRLAIILRNKHVKHGIISMVFGQFVMTLLMVITPLHMDYHAHSTWSISWVIMGHALGMFGISGITGRLIQLYGQKLVILIGMLILLISCLIVPVSPKFLPLALALFLLGVGWNFCFIGGSSLLSSTLLPIERGRIQGINETFIALAASLASLTTGYLFDLGGITLLAVIGILSSLTLGIKCFFYNINQIEKI